MLANAGGSSAVGSPAAHPSYGAVSAVCLAHPTQAAALLQTYLDLTHAAATWQEVESCELRSGSNIMKTTRPEVTLSSIEDTDAEQLIHEGLAQWRGSSARLGLISSDPELSLAALIGRRKDSKQSEVILPVSVTHHLGPSQFEQIFGLVEELASQGKAAGPLETDHILLSVIAQDSTLVYYRLSKGMVKPVN